VRVVFVGDLGAGRTGRHRFLAAQRLGHEVTGLDTAARSPGRVAGFAAKVALRLGRHLDLDGLSARLSALARQARPDVVWLDKVLTLDTPSLARLRRVQPNLRIVFYHPDDFRSRFNWPDAYSRRPDLIDLVVSTKSYNVAEYSALGFADVMFVNNTFEPTEHRPPADADLSADRRLFTHEVGFVGGYEADRAGLVRGLAERGIAVSVQGSFWERAGPLPSNVGVELGDLGAPHYADRLYRTKINLAFLRKVNRDLQTTRSFEIPASGGFMLSERTDELTALLRPGVEAEYFSSLDELEHKCRRYLAADGEREAIARAGRERVWSGGFRTDDMVADVLVRAARA
jgi:spore maturation protein CgeB